MLRAPSLIRATLAWVRRLFAPCFARAPEDVRGAVQVDPGLVVETAPGEVHVASEPARIRMTDTRPRLRVTLVLREACPEQLSRALRSAGVASLSATGAPGRRV